MVILTKAEPHLLHNTVNAPVIILCSKIGFYMSQTREQSAACKSQLESSTQQISAVSFPAESVSSLHTVYNIVTQATSVFCIQTRDCLLYEAQKNSAGVLQVHSCPRIHWFSIRGLPLAETTIEKKKQFVSYKTSAKRERTVT
jgi:hypothetical protein